MKKLVLGSFASLATACAAHAADLAVPSPLPPAAPISIWSGFYLGGSAGAAAGTAIFSDPLGPSVFGDRVNTAAFVGGLQLGYNWQVAPRWIVGLQADASYLDSNGSFTCLQARTTLIGSNCEVSPHGLATAAGRIGFLVDPLHRTLIYGKAGGAWMDSHVVVHPNAGIDAPTTTDASAWGGMVGAGIERALTPAWSIILEYD